MADHPLYMSRAWRVLRARVLNRNPLCAQCLERGIRVLATCVDHILPVRLRPDLSLVESNLRSCCVSCNRRNSDKDYGKQTSAPKTGCDVDGVPLGKAGDDWRA